MGDKRCPVSINKWGSTYIPAFLSKQCGICAKKAYYVDVCAETPICSEKCAKILKERIDKKEKEFEENELRTSYYTGCTSEEWFDFLASML